MRKFPQKVTITRDRRMFLDEQFKKQKVQLSDLNINDNEVRYCSEKIVHYIKQLELNHNSITSDGILHLHGLKWKMLVRIQLMSNKIGNKGCYYLSRMKLNSLETIFLNNNQICSAGMHHLCKSQWKNLKTIVLYYNQIGDGVKMLSRTHWKTIYDMHLGWNRLEMDKTLHLILGQWKLLATIGFRIRLIYEAEEQETILTYHYLLFKSKYPQIRGFNVVKMIRHMTA